MTESIVIWGASGHALVVADIIRLQGRYEIIGFLDNINPERAGEAFCGTSILGGLEQLDRLFQSGVRWAGLGFGHCPARMQAAHMLSTKGLALATAIHPSAIIAADVIIGAGTVVAAGAVINPGVRVGENVIINTSSSIDHETIIGAGAHICPGVRLAGRVNIGPTTLVGIGATVSDRISIGGNTIIGAGAVVVKDIPANVVAYGNPARVMRTVE